MKRGCVCFIAGIFSDSRFLEFRDCSKGTVGESLLIAIVLKQMMKSHYCLADEVWCVDGNNLKEITVSLVRMWSPRLCLTISTTSLYKNSHSSLWSFTLTAPKAEIHFYILLSPLSVFLPSFFESNWPVEFLVITFLWTVEVHMAWWTGKKSALCINTRAKKNPAKKGPICWLSCKF